MEEGKISKLTEVLFINMFGEGARNKDVIYISDFDRNKVESKVCLRIAMSVASLYNYKVSIGCGIFQYWKVLRENKIPLFKNKRLVRNKINFGRKAIDWVGDISNAFGEDISVWNDVWEHLNGK